MMRLEKVKSWGNGFLFFWVNGLENKIIEVLSPYFDSEEEAEEWKRKNYES